MRFSCYAAAVLCFLIQSSIQAETVIGEGFAPIEPGHQNSAREEALRSALADAARQGVVKIDARTGTTSQGIQNFDEVVLSSRLRIEHHKILQESAEDGVYRVRLEAQLGDVQGGTAQACTQGHVRRLLLAGFPLLRPEQILIQEMNGYAQLTASEVARRFPEKPAILVDYQGDLMINPLVPERVADTASADLQGARLVREAARHHRAQYVLAGRFLSLALAADEKSREIVLDVLILDASTGFCVARRRFHRTAYGNVKVPSSIIFGSAAHYATDFGKAYAYVLDEVIRWAEVTASCLPFSARIIRRGQNLAYLDAGAEQGLSVGDIFSVFRSDNKPVTTLSGEVLGYEKRSLGEVVITTVYPRFAIGRLKSPGGGVQLEVGDELHEH